MESRFRRYKSDGKRMVKLLREIAFDERLKKKLDRMDSCGSVLQFLECSVDSSHDSRLQHANFCMNRFCPMCQWRRGLKYSHEVYSLLHKYFSEHPDMGLVHLTVTLRNTEEYTRVMHDRFLTHFKIFRKSKVMERVVGGLWAIEVTDKGRGFHPHIHALCIVPRNGKGLPVLAPQADLSKEWFRITGDSFVVGVRAIYDKDSLSEDSALINAQCVDDNALCSGYLVGLEKAVVEVCKYPFGGVEVSQPERVLMLMDTFEGRRMVGTWGCLYGLEVDESDLIRVGDEVDVSYCRVCGSGLCEVDYIWSNTFYGRHVKLFN